METGSIKIILLGLTVFLITPILALAQEPLPQPSIPGSIEGSGTYFEITDSEYLNVFLQSTEEVTVLLESIPSMISLSLEASTSSNSTVLTIGNLGPNTTYSKFEDSYKNEAVFISDENGGYSWTQDLTQSHHIWFQPADNGTVFLPEECTTYGTWDEPTLTCILTQDLTESVEITESNIALDCSGHSIIGIGTGFGIHLDNRKDLTIKNCLVGKFSFGIFLNASSYNNLTDITVSQNQWVGMYLNQGSHNILANISAHYNDEVGIILNSSSNNALNHIDTFGNRLYGIVLQLSAKDNTLSDITITNNKYGIALNYSSDSNTLTNATIENNWHSGILMYLSSNNVFIDNTVSGSWYGIYFYYYSTGHRIHHNNFVNNTTQAYVWWESSGIFDNGYPSGGNYWSDYVGVDLKRGPYQDEEGSDGIGDTPYAFPGGRDRYPFMEESGWVEKTLSEKAADLAKELVNSAYLYGGKGWDYNQSEFVVPNTIKTGYVYWNQVLNATATGAGVDCSGLIMWAYDRSFDPLKSRFDNFVKAEGADEQYRYNTTSTTESQLQPGDVMFFDFKPTAAPDGFIDHAAMYVGESGGYDVISAANPVRGIVPESKNTLKNLSRFRGFKKVVSALQPAVLVAASSPVDLTVTDPDGFTITPETIIPSDLEFLRQIPGVLYYSEMKKGADGNPIDQVYSYTSKTGDYKIQILPVSGASPTATYTLDFTAGNQSIILAQNLPISQIPINGYGITMSATGTISSFIPIAIDIKPGSYPNSINLKSKGTTPVAVLTDEFFNAKDIIIDSVVFVGASPKKGKLEDIDNDGDLDLILHFDTQSLQLSPVSTEAILTGQLANGNLIKGIDSVRIVQRIIKQTIFTGFFSYVNQFIQNLISAIGLAAITK